MPELGIEADRAAAAKEARAIGLKLLQERPTEAEFFSASAR